MQIPADTWPCARVLTSWQEFWFWNFWVSGTSLHYSLAVFLEYLNQHCLTCWRWLWRIENELLDLLLMYKKKISGFISRNHPNCWVNIVRIVGKCTDHLRSQWNRWITEAISIYVCVYICGFLYKDCKKLTGIKWEPLKSISNFIY